MNNFDDERPMVLGCGRALLRNRVAAADAVAASNPEGHNQYTDKNGNYDPDKEYGPRTEKYKGLTIERSGGAWSGRDPETGKGFVKRSTMPATFHVRTNSADHMSNMSFDDRDQAKKYIDNPDGHTTWDKTEHGLMKNLNQKDAE